MSENFWLSAKALISFLNPSNGGFYAIFFENFSLIQVETISL